MNVVPRRRPRQVVARGPESREHGFAAYLRCQPDETARKGERTRRQIKAAAARCLGRQGFHDLRVADVAAAARVASGTVYIYFPNLETLTLEVLSDFLAWIMGEVRKAGAGLR